MKNKIFNKILNNSNLSLTLKSINALHIVKFHSFFTEKKVNFLSITSSIFKNLILNFFYNSLHIFKFKKIKKLQITKKKILIISHLINKEHINVKEDFYFGDFEKILNKTNNSYYKLQINHTKYSSSHLNSINKLKNCHILDKNLNICTETTIFFKKILAFFELINLYLIKKINYQHLLILTVSLFSSSTTFSLRMYYQTQNYVKSIKPDYCILTYEGYSWERMSIQGAKSISPKIKCIGLQHTPVTDDHHAIFNILPGSFNPNYIWCSQKTSYSILKKRIKYKKKNLIYFIGNFKKSSFRKSKKKKNNTFLVIPEGIYSECVNLFKISLSLAKKYEKYNFIWRVHPVIDLKRVIKNLNLNLRYIPKNIKISKEKFETDINNSKYVIYKGSAAVLKSVIMGNFPIYFQSRDEKNFDPLAKFFLKENYFRNKNEFLNLVEKLKGKTFKKKFKKKISLIKKNSFSKVNISKIKKHLI